MRTSCLGYSFLNLFIAICVLNLQGIAQDTSRQIDPPNLMNNAILVLNDKTSRANNLNASQESAIILRNHDAPFFKKIVRGEKFIGGLELISMGILIAAPKKWTKWDEDWMQEGHLNLKRAWTRPPVWDKDDWDVNYIGHSFAGSYYYNTVRSQNATPLQSFAFSAFQSALWEYVIEGIAERPSIQDLVFTPISGIILGEVTHRLTLRMRKHGFSFAEKVFVLTFNPMYVLNNGFRTKRDMNKNNLIIY